MANEEVYDITDALVVPSLSKNEFTLPHAVDTNSVIHFCGVKTPVIPNCKGVDIRIGQSDKLLLTVLKEQKGQKPAEPNLVFTRLGPIASGGIVQCRSNSFQTLKIHTSSDESNCSTCAKLRQEINTVKDSLRKQKLLDKEIELSKDNELTSSLVEPFIKVVNCGYEIPVPSKSNIIKTLPNSYSMALRRTLFLRKSASRNPQMKKTLINTFSELITQGWIVPADKERQENQANLWYLPYFVANNSAKSKVVYMARQ